MSFKKPAVAQLDDHEWQIIKNAQEKYITDGNGQPSIKKILLIGANAILSKSV